MLETTEYKETLDSFYNYLFGVIKLHRDTIPKLKDELMLIQSDSIDELNNNLNSQQLFLYQIKSFDKEVADYMEKMNVNGSNITEVIQQLPQDEQMRFYELIGQFEATVKEMNFYKEKCQMLLETKLHIVNKNIAQLEVNKEKTTYKQDGKEDNKTNLPRTFEKSI